MILSINISRYNNLDSKFDKDNIKMTKLIAFLNVNQLIQYTKFANKPFITYRNNGCKNNKIIEI
jgi:hypothetical protein